VIVWEKIKSCCLPSFSVAKVCQVDVLVRIHLRINSNTNFCLHCDFGITEFQNVFKGHNSGRVRIYIGNTFFLSFSFGNTLFLIFPTVSYSLIYRCNQLNQ
jgi:hypothetical protein